MHFKMLAGLRKLQPKILVFTFGASLVPVVFLVGAAWQFGNQPLTNLEKTRLDDQMLAFRGYTAASEKGLQDLAASYAFWTDLFNAVQQRDQAWIRREVSDQLVFSTDIDAVKVLNQSGTILGSQGTYLKNPSVASEVSALVKTGQVKQTLVETSSSTSSTTPHSTTNPSNQHQLLMLTVAPIYQSNGKGETPGTLVLGQVLDQAWLRKFLNYSQPTTKLKILSLQGNPIVASHAEAALDEWEKAHLTSEVVPAIQQGQSFYRIEPESGLNTIYAPLLSQNQPIAIAKIQIVSGYFSQAKTTLNHLLWLGLGLATLLSVAIAHLLSRQIGQPINQLAKRSKTLAAGDLTTPIPGVGSGGEIGQLANAYQEMAQSLRNLIEGLEQRVAERTQELEQARQTLEERVRDRTEEVWQKHQQLQEAHDQLQQLNTELTTKALELGDALQNLQKAQAQLIQTEKMSSLGQMVAGVAHEINNPINFIYGNLPYISRYTQDLVTLVHTYQERYSDPDIDRQIEQIDFDFLCADLPKILASMETGSDRIRQIVLSLRNFSRLDEADMKQVDIHEGIESTLLMLQHRLTASDHQPGIRLSKHYSELPRIECHPRQLNQVFMNVLSNAIDALEAEQRGGRKIWIYTQVASSNHVQIKIRDNGPGIPAEIQEKLFDPFFTTKPVGKGTGLGLTVCYQILERHHGHLDIISEPGQGTEVVIELPIEVSPQNVKPIAIAS